MKLCKTDKTNENAKAQDATLAFSFPQDGTETCSGQADFCLAEGGTFVL